MSKTLSEVLAESGFSINDYPLDPNKNPLSPANMDPSWLNLPIVVAGKPFFNELKEHKFVDAEYLKNHKEDSFFKSMVLNGGLSICQVCNCAEGSLTTHCSGSWVDGDKQDKIYAGNLDFKDGQWIEAANPTNQILENSIEKSHLKQEQLNNQI